MLCVVCDIVSVLLVVLVVLPLCVLVWVHVLFGGNDVVLACDVVCVNCVLWCGLGCCDGMCVMMCVIGVFSVLVCGV